MSQDVFLLGYGHYGNGPIRSSIDRLLRMALMHASTPNSPTANAATTAPRNMDPSTDKMIPMAIRMKNRPNMAVTMRRVLDLGLLLSVRFFMASNVRYATRFGLYATSGGMFAMNEANSLPMSWTTRSWPGTRIVFAPEAFHRDVGEGRRPPDQQKAVQRFNSNQQTQRANRRDVPDAQ